MTRTLFHGTTVAGLVGKTLLPAARSGRKPLYIAETDPEYAYATSEDHVWHYAEAAWRCADNGIPRAYEVEPLDPRDVEEDPMYADNGECRSVFADDRRSRSGFRVVRELPMPDDMGPADEWR